MRLCNGGNSTREIGRPDENVSKYLAELRKLAQDCNFGDSLMMMLRDRLVCGINDDRIQRRLLWEDRLTFERALNLHKPWKWLTGILWTCMACKNIASGTEPRVR